MAHPGALPWHAPPLPDTFRVIVLAPMALAMVDEQLHRQGPEGPQEGDERATIDAKRQLVALRPHTPRRRIKRVGQKFPVKRALPRVAQVYGQLYLELHVVHKVGPVNQRMPENLHLPAIWPVTGQTAQHAELSTAHLRFPGSAAPIGLHPFGYGLGLFRTLFAYPQKRGDLAIDRATQPPDRRHLDQVLERAKSKAPSLAPCLLRKRLRPYFSLILERRCFLCGPDEIDKLRVNSLHRRR